MKFQPNCFLVNLNQMLKRNNKDKWYKSKNPLKQGLERVFAFIMFPYIGSAVPGAGIEPFW